jgi:enoyl-[acyl-carrier protein] reductase II
MKNENKITKLFNINYPVIQGGMVWVSGWRLVSAVSNCGGLGLIGAGSMKPEMLKKHIRKCKTATTNPFGVNVPLLREDAENIINTIIDEKIKIVFTSAGNPGKFIGKLKKNNITVVHVVSNLKQGLKAESVGCDAVVGEGVEAGGHNGADEIPVTELVKELSVNLNIPVIAAGGIVNKKDVEKVFLLGAEGVQIGTLFAVSKESSAHENYKKAILSAQNGDTVLLLKKIGLIRAIKNPFAERVIALEKTDGTLEELTKLLGKKRERLGIFEGDIVNGLLEAGVGAEKIDKLKSVKEIFNELV